MVVKQLFLPDRSSVIDSTMLNTYPIQLTIFTLYDFLSIARTSRKTTYRNALRRNSGPLSNFKLALYCLLDLYELCS